MRPMPMLTVPRLWRGRQCVNVNVNVNASILSFHKGFVVNGEYPSNLVSCLTLLSHRRGGGNSLTHDGLSTQNAKQQPSESLNL